MARIMNMSKSMEEFKPTDDKDSFRHEKDDEDLTNTSAETNEDATENQSEHEIDAVNILLGWKQPSDDLEADDQTLQEAAVGEVDRTEFIEKGINFLLHPNLQNTPMSNRAAFLWKKGLTKSEIQAAIYAVMFPPEDSAISPPPMEFNTSAKPMKNPPVAKVVKMRPEVTPATNPTRFYPDKKIKVPRKKMEKLREEIPVVLPSQKKRPPLGSSKVPSTKRTKNHVNFSEEEESSLELHDSDSEKPVTKAASASSTQPRVSKRMVRGRRAMSEESQEAIPDTIPRGTPVSAKFEGSRAYWPGVITELNRDGSYEIEFEDGDRDYQVARASIKLTLVNPARALPKQQRVRSSRATSEDSSTSASVKDGATALPSKQTAPKVASKASATFVPKPFVLPNDFVPKWLIDLDTLTLLLKVTPVDLPRIAALVTKISKASPGEMSEDLDKLVAVYDFNQLAVDSVEATEGLTLLIAVTYVWMYRFIFISSDVEEMQDVEMNQFQYQETYSDWLTLYGFAKNLRKKRKSMSEKTFKPICYSNIIAARQQD